MAIVGTDVYRLVVDDKNFTQSLNAAQSKAKTFGDRLTTVGRNLTTFVTPAILGIGTASVIAASNAEEIENKFEAVFKNSADDVRAWADQFAESLGRSSTEQLQFLSTIQDTLVPLGFLRENAAETSKTVVELATDLASFNNLDTADVVRDIQSAIVGNTETLRKYGVVASQAAIEQEALTSGLIDNKSELDATAKAQAILNLIIEGTADAQGDAARTADSFANQLRSLKSQLREAGENIGAILIPALSNIITSINNTIQNFNNLDPSVQKIIVALGAVAAAVGPVLLVLPKLIAGVQAVGVAFTTLTGPVGLITAGLAVLTAGIIVVARRAKQYREETDQLNLAVSGQLETIQEYEAALEILEKRYETNAAELSSARNEQQRLSNSYNEARQAMDIYNKAMEDGFDVLSRSEREFLQLQLVRNGMAEDTAEAIVTEENLSMAYLNLQDRLHSLSFVMQNNNYIVEEGNEYLEQKAAITENMTRIQEEQLAQEQALREELEEQQRALQAELKAEQEREQAQLRAAQTAEERAKLEEQLTRDLIEQSGDRIALLEYEKEQELEYAREIQASRETLAQIEELYAQRIQEVRDDLDQERERQRQQDLEAEERLREEADRIAREKDEEARRLAEQTAEALAAIQAEITRDLFTQADDRIALIELEKNARIEAAEEAGANAETLAQIELYYANEIAEVQEQQAEAARQRAQEERQRAEEKREQKEQELEDERERLQAELDAAREQVQERIDLEQSYYNRYAELHGNRVYLLQQEREAAIREAEEAGLQTYIVEQYYNELLDEAREEMHQAERDRIAQELQDRVDLFTSTLGYLNQFLSVFGDIQSSFYERSLNEMNARYDEELERLLDTYEAQKKWIEDNIADETERTEALRALDEEYDADKAAIEEEAAEREKQIQRDQAIAAKKVAIFESIINGIRAVAESLPNIPLSILVGALAAAQTAAIIAKPIPQLAEGGIATRATQAIVGEGNSNEAIIPLSDEVLASIGRGIAEASGNTTAAASKGQNVFVLELNGTELGRAITNLGDNRDFLIKQSNLVVS